MSLCHVSESHTFITRTLILAKLICLGWDSNISGALQLYQVFSSLITYVKLDHSLFVMGPQFLIISLKAIITTNNNQPTLLSLYAWNIGPTMTFLSTGTFAQVITSLAVVLCQGLSVPHLSPFSTVQWVLNSKCYYLFCWVTLSTSSVNLGPLRGRG